MRGRSAFFPLVLSALLSAIGDRTALARPEAAVVPTPAPRPCGLDEVLHRVTAPRPGSLVGKPAAACPASPAGLEDVRSSEFSYFDHDSDFEAELARRGFPGFIFEFEQRANYPSDRARGGYHPGGSTLWVVECYYLGCTRVPVASTGPAERTGGRKAESCIGPFPGGTSVPAPGAARCPRAVQIAGQFRNLSRSDDRGMCCYPVPPPVPP